MMIVRPRSASPTPQMMESQRDLRQYPSQYQLPSAFSQPFIITNGGGRPQEEPTTSKCHANPCHCCRLPGCTLKVNCFVFAIYLYCEAGASCPRIFEVTPFPFPYWTIIVNAVAAIVSVIGGTLLLLAVFFRFSWAAKTVCFLMVVCIGFLCAQTVIFYLYVSDYSAGLARGKLSTHKDTFQIILCVLAGIVAAAALFVHIYIIVACCALARNIKLGLDPEQGNNPRNRFLTVSYTPTNVLVTSPSGFMATA